MALPLRHCQSDWLLLLVLVYQYLGTGKAQDTFKTQKTEGTNRS